MGKGGTFDRSYADFGLARSARQVVSAVRDRGKLDAELDVLAEQMREVERRVESVRDGPMADLSLLEIGPGQGMERALYLSQRNDVTTLDSDVIPLGFEPASYAAMLRANGASRVLKTAGRELIVGRRKRGAWRARLDAPDEKRIHRRFGDVHDPLLRDERFDGFLSWSVFEHVADPGQALDNLFGVIRPGGFFYISLHLWTSTNGHHDIRSFTSDRIDALPLWAHLREDTRDMIKPSSYLNEWRLERWRELFASKAPGSVEVLEQYEHPEVIGPRIEGELAGKLDGYSREELLTVALVYYGRVPDRA